jgi:competence protein ComEC
MEKKILFLFLTLIFGWLILSEGSSFLKPKILSGFESEVLKIVFFDVGQGDAVLISLSSGEKILVDGGPDKKLLHKLPDQLPLFSKKLDYVILTHPHADHLAALPEILRRYEVGQVITTGVIHTTTDYLEFLQVIKDKNIPVTFIEEPQELVIGETVLQFLTPPESLREKKLENLNNSSLVFRLTYKENSVLFTGDYEKEEQLINQENELVSQILKVSHHGANNGNDVDFLAAVSPERAIISVGKNNKFGHPNYRVLHELKDLGAEILRTDELGDIIFVGDGETFSQL